MEAVDSFCAAIDEIGLGVPTKRFELPSWQPLWQLRYAPAIEFYVSEIELREVPDMKKFVRDMSHIKLKELRQSGDPMPAYFLWNLVRAGLPGTRPGPNEISAVYGVFVRKMDEMKVLEIIEASNKDKK